MLGVAVGEVVDEAEVGLRGAGGEARRRPDPLDVEDDHRDLGVVGEPDELRHQRDAGTGGRGHRPGARPAGADGHPDRGQLVLGLDDGDLLLARLRVDSEPVGVGGQGLADRGGGGDRVPGGDRAAAHQAAQRDRLVALDQDQALGLPGHRLQRVAVLLLEILIPVVHPDLDRVEVHLDRFGLGLEVTPEAVVDRLQGDVEEPGDDADIEHVEELLAQLVVVDPRFRQLGERDRVVEDIIPRAGGRVSGVVDDRGAGLDSLQIGLPGRRVERDQDLGIALPGHVALRRDADLEPGRQPLDVGREDVLGRDRYAHVEDRTH